MKNHLLTLSLLGLLVACASTGPSGFETRTAATEEVMARLEAGRGEEARELYDAFGSWRHDPSALAASVYSASKSAFERGQTVLAADALTLLSERDGESREIAEAHVYALFLVRAESGPSIELTDRMEAAVDRLRELQPSRPGWVDLAEAQLRIDQGEVVLAQRSFETFRSAWTGYPTELEPYVLDVERFLDVHSSAGTR